MISKLYRSPMSQGATFKKGKNETSMSEKQRIASSYGRKDASGAYEPKPKVPDITDNSIDGLLQFGLEGIQQLLMDIRKSIATGDRFQGDGAVAKGCNGHASRTQKEGG